MTTAITQITELYNESWAEDRELSATTIKRRLRWNSIDVCETGEWSLWIDDGDLFDGHHIRVDVDGDDDVSFELLG